MPSITMTDDQLLDGVIVPREVLMREKRRVESPFITHKVDAVGPDCKQIKVGDTIIVNRHQVHPLPIDGEDLYFVDETMVVSIVG